MEGVNILTTVVVMEATGWFPVYLIIGLVLMIVGGLWASDSGLSFGNCITIVLGFLCLIGCFSPISMSRTTQYKATIEDTVVFSDFVEKYEIVEQQDKMFTLQLRGDK